MHLDNLTPEVLRAALTMLGIGVGTVVAMFVIGVVVKHAGTVLKERKPLDVTMLAVVEGKRTSLVTQDDDRADSPREIRCFVTFLPDAECAMELEVPAEIYDTIREGTRGYLTVQGRAYVSFTAEDEVAKA